MPRLTSPRVFALLLLAVLALGIRLVSWASDGSRRPHAPVAVADTRSTVADTPIRFSVLTNDWALGILDPTTISLMPSPGGPRHASVEVAHEGSFRLDAAGQLIFTPAAGFLGTTQITYAVRDAAGTVSAPAVVTVHVAPRRGNEPLLGQPATLVIYPNPATDLVALDLRTVPAGTYAAVVTDGNGRIVRRQAVTAGTAALLALPELVAGRYCVAVRGTTTAGDLVRLTEWLIKE